MRLSRSVLFSIFIAVQSFGYCEDVTKENDNSKTVFLTGAAGFIGSNFLEYMYDVHPDYNFVVLDALTYAGSLDNISDEIKASNRFKFVHGSVTNYPLVEEIMQTSDFVVHFAAESHVTRSLIDGHSFFDTDVMGTLSMMAALKNNVNKVERFVHISTSEVYGTAEQELIDEQHILNPKTPYAAAKAAADRLVYGYCCSFDLPVVTIRPFNNYGPRQHPEKMIPHFIISAIEGKQITIHGTGEQTRDWVSTRDVAVAIDKALHIPDFSTIRNQAINVGTGKGTSVIDIAKFVLKYFDLPESYLEFLGDRPGQVENQYSSQVKAKELLDWSPSTELEAGLKATIEWYVANAGNWDKKREDAIVDVEEMKKN